MDIQNPYEQFPVSVHVQNTHPSRHPFYALLATCTLWITVCEILVGDYREGNIWAYLCPLDWPALLYQQEHVVDSDVTSISHCTLYGTDKCTIVVDSDVTSISHCTQYGTHCTQYGTDKCTMFFFHCSGL